MQSYSYDDLLVEAIPLNASFVTEQLELHTKQMFVESLTSMSGQLGDSDNRQQTRQYTIATDDLYHHLAISV